MEKGFGDLLSDSWKEYKNNFKIYAIIIILLSFIPSLIMYILLYSLGLSTANLSENLTFSQIAPYIIPFFIIVIIVTLLSFLMHASLTFNSLYKKKTMSVGNSLKGGKKYFWKYLGLTLLIMAIFFGIIFIIIGIGVGLYSLFENNPVGAVLMILITIALMIAAILYFIRFGVFWIFSSYVLIGENKGIIESLRGSYRLVKGKWWKTFGYLFLIGLILWVILVAFSVPALIINKIIDPDYSTKTIYAPAANILLSTQIVSLIFTLFANIITSPLFILFFKNFYLETKKGNPRKK